VGFASCKPADTLVAIMLRFVLGTYECYAMSVQFDLLKCFLSICSSHITAPYSTDALSLSIILNNAQFVLPIGSLLLTMLVLACPLQAEL